jgi:hypothetical protein
MPEKLGIHLPRVFEASDGRADCEPPKGGDTGILLRDTSLAALMVHAGRGYAVAVDIDSVEGLSDDGAACEFLVLRLGFRIVLAHHPATAATIAELGALALLRVFAVDSTGLRSSLESNPPGAGIGSVVSPPILAYGLIDRPADIAACMRCADAIVLSRGALARARTSKALAEIAREAQQTAG